MTKRITIQSGDFVLLSDIPNEQVFNLVKECFGNAGFVSIHQCTWDATTDWECLVGTSMYSSTPHATLAMECSMKTLRQLSLSDVFNSTNGGFRWFGESYAHIYKHEILFSDSEHASCPLTVQRIYTVSSVYDNYGHIKLKAPDTYKISKAFDLEILQYMDIKDVQGVAIGKTAAHLLGLISKAMSKPEEWVKITSDTRDTSLLNCIAFKQARSLCCKLEFDWMEFSISGNSMRYMPYQTVKLVTKWERVE